MKNTKTVKRISALAATALMAVTALAGAAVTASAHSIDVNTTSATQSIQAKTIKLTAYGKTSYGYDYTYYTNNDVATVKARYDFNTNKYTFILTGKNTGVADMQLVYYISDTKAKVINIKVSVDKKMNVTQLSHKEDSKVITVKPHVVPEKKTTSNTTNTIAEQKTSKKASEKVINENAKKVKVTAYGKTSYGYNYTYTTTQDIARVTVKYDFNTNKYTFILAGKMVGTADMKLVYYTADKATKTITIKISVDKNGNVTRL